jgi:Tol biopolymer transport system component
MSLQPGTRLGNYEILSPLGAGGMGEVYKARDTRLNRTVAIKVLPYELAQNQNRRARFEREARAVSALNHPHICTLYDIGREDRVDYLVLEYLEGETLADRLTRGALPIEQALRVGAQVADALATAHRAGVVHRDLKPGNIILTKSGAKLLDFGLARVEEPIRLPAGSALPTQVKPLTAEGSILGTLQYMSPEQLEGKEADGRTDIFAFGAVAYEMATGRRAFEGQSPASVIAAILERDPPSISALAPMTPAGLDRAVKRCLAKSPDDRWQSARDLESELRWIGETTANPAPPAITRRYRTAWVTAVFLGMALLVTLYARHAPVDGPALQLSMLPPDNSTFGEFALSPDGRQLAFTATQAGKTHLWLRSLDSPLDKPLPETEGAGYPFWSHDGRSVGFFAGGRLKVIDIAAGRSRTLAGVRTGRGGTWNRNDMIVFAPDVAANLQGVSAAGGTPVSVTTLDTTRGENSHRFPQFLPDGQHFIYYARTREPEDTGIYCAALGSKEVKRLVVADSAGVATSNHYLLFVREPMLMAQRFQEDDCQVVGDPMIAADQVWQHGLPGFMPVSASKDTLVYRRTTLARSELQWLNREGEVLESVGALDAVGFSLAPDDQHLALSRFDARAADIWLMETTRRALSRFTSGPTTEWVPVWSPDKSSIVFASDRRGPMDLYLKRFGADANEELLLQTAEWKLPSDWSQDGRLVAYQSVSAETKGDVWAVPVAGDRKPFPLIRTQFDEFDGVFSSDGRWIGYTSDETGRLEVYIQEMSPPNSQAAGSKLQVSVEGGSRLRWRRDATEVFYIAPDGELISVPLKMQRTLVAGTPEKLFHTAIRNPTSITDSPGYAAAADGQRFLMYAPSQSPIPSRIEVVLNWPTALIR